MSRPRLELVVGAGVGLALLGVGWMFTRRRRALLKALRHSKGKLRLLVTTDTHSAMLPAAGTDGVLRGGAPQRAFELARQRAECAREARTCLLLDNGDAFQGTPFYSAYKGEVDMKAMHQMGYESTTAATAPHRIAPHRITSHRTASHT